MPFIEIPPASLPHLTLFGYDLIFDEGAFAWYAGPCGRTRIEKSRPIVWVEDIADAGQLNAVAILQLNSSDD